MINYQRRGQGVPLVLVHGFLAGSNIWQIQLEYFSKDFDVIAIDLPGFGFSSDRQPPSSIEGFAQSVLDLLDHLEIEKFCLMGHSMGGMIVQQMAYMVQDRITHLICYGTGSIGILPDRFEPIEISREKLHQSGLENMGREIAATWFGRGVEDVYYPLCLAMVHQATIEAADNSFTAWQNWDGRQQLKGIKAKTLILWGEKDRSYGWSQIEVLWRGINESSLSVIPGCFHNVHLEKPLLFNMIVKDFLTVKVKK